MRPGMNDQLAGVRRILEEIIAPELRPGYPSQVLRGVVKNLAMLEGAWASVAPFLEWDSEATASLLRDAAPHVDEELRRRIGETLEAGACDGSVEALEQRNETLRGLLAEAIPQLARHGDGAADAHERVKAHLRERTREYPFRMAVAAPTSKQ
jgi:hypothetical protein